MKIFLFFFTLLWFSCKINAQVPWQALHHTIDQLDDGIDKNKRILSCSHSATLPEADCTNLCIDLIQSRPGLHRLLVSTPT